MDFFELVGRVTSLCGCVTAMCAVILLIVSIVKKAKAPNALQDQRLEGHDADIKELRERLDEHDQYFKNDLARFKKVESGNRIMQRCMLALLAHNIDGNDIEGMKKAKQDLQDYLIEQ